MAKQANEPKSEAATFRLPADLLKKVKYIAMMDDTTQTQILQSTLSEYVSKWEKKNGEIPVKK